MAGHCPERFIERKSSYHTSLLVSQVLRPEQWDTPLHFCFATFDFSHTIDIFRSNGFVPPRIFVCRISLCLRLVQIKLRTSATTCFKCFVFYDVKMNPKISLLLAMTIVAVGGSFLKSPTQFHTTFNSTFLRENEKLFKPIIIPNITEPTRVKGKEVVLNKIQQPQEISEETKHQENSSDEEAKPTRNSLKFSSRYSTKPETSDEDPTDESGEEKSVEAVETTSIGVENRKFSDRSDDLANTEEEEEEDTFRYNELKEAEQSEIASTTNEPYTELQRATSFRSSPYPDDDLENYETTSASAEEIDSSSEEKEDEEEGKRSVPDYHNSGSKNYHSIQTPLNHVKYRGPHSFDSEEVRTRLISPIPRHHIKHNWPYSRYHIKSQLDKLNEISDSDETYEKNLDEEVKAEVKSKPKHLGLELAVEKDEFKFDRTKKYNYIEDRNRRKQQQKSLTAAEEKDNRRPLFQSLKQYQVEEPKYQSSTKGNEISTFPNAWTSQPLITTPKTGFRSSTSRKYKQYSTSIEPFHGHQFLGPVVFNQTLEEQKIKPVSKSPAKYFPPQKPPSWNILPKGLLLNEKLDQNKLTNEKIQKSVFAAGSFNHLEESHEIYNAILANIQSIFGVRTQPLNGRKGSDINLDESKSLTWSTPLKV